MPFANLCDSECDVIFLKAIGKRVKEHHNTCMTEYPAMNHPISTGYCLILVQLRFIGLTSGDNLYYS
jgi:hypothetical protein